MCDGSEVRSRVCLLKEKVECGQESVVLRHISKAGLAVSSMATGEWEKSWWVQVHDSITFSLYAPMFMSAAAAAWVPSFSVWKKQILLKRIEEKT